MEVTSLCYLMKVTSMLSDEGYLFMLSDESYLSYGHFLRFICLVCLAAATDNVPQVPLRQGSNILKTCPFTCFCKALQNTQFRATKLASCFVNATSKLKSTTLTVFVTFLSDH
jgi:hypothetical protein